MYMNEPCTKPHSLLAKLAEVAEKYAPAATNGHDVIPCVFEEVRRTRSA